MASDAEEKVQNINTHMNDQKSENITLQDPSCASPSDEIPNNSSPPSNKSSSAPPGVRYRVEWQDSRTKKVLHRQVIKQHPYDPEKLSRERRVFDVVTIQKAKTKASISTGDSDSDTEFASGSKESFLPDFSEKPKVKLMIYSKAIINALRSIIRYYPSQCLTGSTIIIEEPYPVLIHHLEELGQFRDKYNPETCIESLCVREEDAYHHLTLLMDFLDEHIMPQVNAERARNAQGFMTWEMVWLNLKPGGFYMSERSGSVGTFNGGVIHSVTTGNDQERLVYFWRLEYDGVRLGRYLDQDFYERQEGELVFRNKDKAYDLDAPDDLTKDLIHRGEKFYQLLKGGCRYYSGLTANFPYHKVDGLVMLDMKGYYSNRPGPKLMTKDQDKRSWVSECTYGVCRVRAREDADEQDFYVSDFDAIFYEDDPELCPKDYFLMPQEIMGFVFKTRTWEVLKVEDFREPQFDPTMIDRLVMDDERRNIIKSLAGSFIRKDHTGQTLEKQPWQADFVKDKGNGQIFLLHGKPGVGKTYTAECVAEYTKRPLMILTSSDIGTNSGRIEGVLTEKFKTAKKWEAILLIDEADIFMERRSTNDLERNTLVAGFLRALEYYDGILFLTTNRVGKFDDAFTSRIHLKLYYPNFSDKDRKDVWKTFMDKLHKDRGSYIRLSIEAREYIRSETMAKVKWNGREIRNGFQTAVALAEYDGEKDEEGTILVQERHLSSVVKMSLEFQEYLDKLHVGNEGKRAQREGERYDDYDQ